MCKPKPGKRCASHTSAAYERLASSAATVLQTGTMEEQQQLVTKLTRNRLDYFATPTGRNALLDTLSSTAPDSPERMNAQHQMESGQLMSRLRKAAGGVINSNPAASKADRTHMAELCEEELYLQAQFWDETHRPAELGIPANTDTIAAQLDRVSQQRRDFAAKAGFDDYPASALPVARCPRCQQFADDTHQCRPNRSSGKNLTPGRFTHHPLAIDDDAPAEFAYMRRPGSSYTDTSDPHAYGRDVEPAGQYLSGLPDSGAPDGWETGTVHADRVLHLGFGGGYDDTSNWKRQLSAHYDGKTGRRLGQAIRADGYDLIVTHDEYGTSECVDLSSYPAPAPAQEAVPAGEPAAKPRKPVAHLQRVRVHGLNDSDLLSVPDPDDATPTIVTGSTGSGTGYIIFPGPAVAATYRDDPSADHRDLGGVVVNPMRFSMNYPSERAGAYDPRRAAEKALQRGNAQALLSVKALIEQGVPSVYDKAAAAKFRATFRALLPDD